MTSPYFIVSTPLPPNDKALIRLRSLTSRPNGKRWRLMALSGFSSPKHANVPLAALWLSEFGGRVVYRLPGWNRDAAASLRVNEVLHWEAVRIARADGAHFYDFGGFERNAAELLLADRGVPAGFEQTPGYFKLASSAVRSELVTDVIGPTGALLRATEYDGFACAEYKFDRRDRRYKLMEVNVRYNLSSALAPDVAWTSLGCSIKSRPDIQWSPRPVFRSASTGSTACGTSVISLTTQKAMRASSQRLSGPILGDVLRHGGRGPTRGRSSIRWVALH